MTITRMTCLLIEKAVFHEETVHVSFVRHLRSDYGTVCACQAAVGTTCACQAAIEPPRGGWIRREPVDLQESCGYNGGALLF